TFSSSWNYALIMDPVEIVLGWRTKAFDLTLTSGDAFIREAIKVFSATKTVLSHGEIESAVKILESDRRSALYWQHPAKVSVLSLGYGLIESLHLTLLRLMGNEWTAAASRAFIEEWQRKARELLTRSKGDIAHVFAKAFAAMAEAFKAPDNRNLRGALKSLEDERNLCFNKPEELSIRSLMNGMVQSIRLTLLYFFPLEAGNEAEEEENDAVMDQAVANPPAPLDDDHAADQQPI
ncbi:hypothetical protein PMAYCL1PPCAC_01436, partial [Pristionchus mayeri]